MIGLAVEAPVPVEDDVRQRHDRPRFLGSAKRCASSEIPWGFSLVEKTPIRQFDSRSNQTATPLIQHWKTLCGLSKSEQRPDREKDKLPHRIAPVRPPSAYLQEDNLCARVFWEWQNASISKHPRIGHLCEISPESNWV
jgi:hypothetical protein